jgi:hypothetical protein
VTGQRGRVWKRGKDDWVVRYRERDGGRAARRVQKGKFKTKGEADDAYLDARLRAIRTGLVDPLLRPVRPLAEQGRDDEVGDQQAQDRFGAIRIDRLNPQDLGAFRHDLPEARRHQVFVAVRQVLEQAVRWKMLTDNPGTLVKNRVPSRGEVSFRPKPSGCTGKPTVASEPPSAAGSTSP